MKRPILFLLPVKGGSGGAHSVMQEAQTLCALGQATGILVNADNAASLRDNYADMPDISKEIHAYAGTEALGQLILKLDPKVVIATTNQSVHVLASVAKTMPNLRTAYYVQDYEPLFYDPDSDDWRLAYTSYALVPNMLLFAKTRWLQEVVHNNHGVSVAKVEPSIDHTIYYPDFSYLADVTSGGASVHICAMVRPKTPRRAPWRTLRILNQILQAYGAAVRISIFGCDGADEIFARAGTPSQVDLRGVLSRQEVGALFRHIDVFLDLSDYQAFGRSAIEAMSCGAVTVVPAHGGAYEFIRDGQNGFVADTRYDSEIMAKINQIMAMSAQERLSLRMRAIEAGYQFSPERAALSELALFTGS